MTNIPLKPPIKTKDNLVKNKFILKLNFLF